MPRASTTAQSSACIEGAISAIRSPTIKISPDGRSPTFGSMLTIVASRIKVLSWLVTRFSIELAICGMYAALKAPLAQLKLYPHRDTESTGWIEIRNQRRLANGIA